VTHDVTARSPTIDARVPEAVAGPEYLRARASRENFPVASFVLPARERRHLLAIYGFARLADDIGDEAPGDRLALLDWLEADLDRAYDGVPEHEAMRALSRTVREVDLPRQPFLDLIEANRRDQVVTRYATYCELHTYCELSANPVGRLVLAVFGVDTPERVRWSDAICTGLQLVEHWQDVGEDFRRGRVYLPADDIARFGCDDRDLEADMPSPKFRRLMEFEIGRADALLDGGGRLVTSVRGRLRLAIAGFVGGGRAAAEAIRRSGYDVLGTPPRAGRAAFLGYFVRAAVRG
jgi:squalene synthase HpnC